MSGDWRLSAACGGTDLHLWFEPDSEPPQGRQRREAKARDICSRCLVRTPCLDFALSLPDLHGWWGGMSEDGRRYERRRMLKRAASAARKAA